MCRSAASGTAVRWVGRRARARGALHSYRLCRNFIRSSLARKRLSLMSGAAPLCQYDLRHLPLINQ